MLDKNRQNIWSYGKSVDTLLKPRNNLAFGNL
jgi:hypothetical protein